MKKLLSIFIFLLGFSAIAQDIHFTQFYATPIFVNPAFTGTAEHSRAAMNFRKQWPGVNANYLSTTLSFDRNLSKFNSGYGVLVSMDRAGTGNLKNSLIGFVYSYRVRPKSGKWTLQTGLNFSYGNTSVNFEKLTFGDQLSVNGKVYDVTLDNPALGSNGYFDFSSGALLFGKNFWLGFSAKHLNTPNQTLIADVSYVPILFSLHGGLKINLVQDYRNKNEVSLRPAFQYKSQGFYDQLDLGSYLMYNQLIFGLWYRGLPIKRYDVGLPNNDAVALLLGYKYDDQWRFGYSYDITVSKLASNSSGAHELSLSYEFSYKHYRKKPKRKDMKNDCPFPMM